MRKLNYDIDRLHSHELTTRQDVIYIAFDCVVTAWSMVDWTFRALNDEQRLRLAGTTKDLQGAPRTFTDLLKGRITGLDLCRQLAVGAKHFDVRQDPIAGLSTTVLEVSFKQRGVDGSVERSGTNYWPSVYVPGQGTTVIDEMLAEVAAGWRRLLDEEMIDNQPVD